MFQFTDKIIDDLIKNKGTLILNITEKYEIHINYDEDKDVFIYVKEYNKKTNKYDTLGNSLSTILFTEHTKEIEIKEAIITSLVNNVFSRIKNNEVVDSLLHKYISFLLRLGIFNAKKLFIHFYNNIVIISCEYFSERELIFVYFKSDKLNYLKNVQYVDKSDYNIYSPFSFILENKIFEESMYYKELKTELAYLAL